MVNETDLERKFNNFTLRAGKRDISIENIAKEERLAMKTLRYKGHVVFHQIN